MERNSACWLPLIPTFVEQQVHMSLPGPLSVLINASAIFLACFVLNANSKTDLLLFLICKWSPLLGPAGCCFPVSPLCSDTSPTGPVFCCPVCCLICSQPVQFAFAEDPQAVVLWTDSRVSRLSLSGGAGHLLLLAARFLLLQCSAEILLLSAQLAQRAPSACPVALFLSGGYSCLPLLSSVPCSEWLHRNPWEHRQLGDVPCYQHASQPAWMALPLCQGWSTAAFEGFSYSWLFRSCVMEKLQCQD